ncbi:MAG: choice-of-anchor D domain-containing protein [Terracidiphilus sp.]
MNIWDIRRLQRKSASDGGALSCLGARALAMLAVAAMLAASAVSMRAQSAVTPARSAQDDSKNVVRRATAPPRVIEARRFLARRGWSGSAARRRVDLLRQRAKTLAAQNQVQFQSQAQASVIWLPLGPVAVQSQNFGLVTGRVSAIALDPSDATGNTVYLGTTGGGVWRSQNADTSDATTVSFVALTDNLAALNGVMEASISIGALTVQPGGTGVILAGTGDPNDALDSYYGVGILRSIDGGANWSLVPATSDSLYSFAGEGFAGFAWSTVNTQLVVAAVSQALDGTLVNAVESGTSYEGLYYSLDGGATWSLATITDGSLEDVQGPNDAFTYPDGNAATSVVWNPVRQLFMAAVRYHGYYQSADGVTWTRMAQQPGGGLTGELCPANSDLPGSTGCPIFRGTLAVNPQTGDTFAWTVDVANQDQGLWQDICAASASSCASTTIWTPLQTQKWDTTALETDTMQGEATIEDGDYTLALAAVPAGIGAQYGTIVLAGADDLWKSDCPYSQGCKWRNTTNSTVGFCAQVGEYQHALAWNTANPLEILVSNDSGLWRSIDAIGETGQVCSASDANHFQNLNGGLGSLAEVVGLSLVGSTPYTMMAGLGVNGTAGVKSTTGPTAQWPEILGGEGGPVAIDPSGISWYVNNQAGVSIHLCSQQNPCTQDDFGATPVVNDADVAGDGLTMTEPAPFLVDPLDSSQLLIGTCRVWRGGTDGTSWTAANAISPMLDGSESPYCKGDALIGSMAAMALPSGGEVIYVGMKGSLDGGATLAGHVLTATFDPTSSAAPAWTDLTLDPVTNDNNAMNLYGLEISSIYIDPHDNIGQTIYVTVAGIRNISEQVQPVYGSIDGGAHWSVLTSNLFIAPANSLVVDPQDTNTVYVATDAGVYSTRQIANCVTAFPGCWSAFGSGLPEAPVVALSAAPVAATVPNLVAATYGRGIWTAPLWTAGEILTTATATPSSLTFASQVVGSSSTAQTVTLKNTGSVALAPTYIVPHGDFSETDDCVNVVVAAGASCAIQVVFTPTKTGSRTGKLTIGVNVAGGDLTVSLGGTGAPAGVVSLSPASIYFGSWQVGTTSTSLQVTAGNSSSGAISYTGAITGPFAIASDGCGGSIAAKSSCTLMLAFTPAQSGGATGALTFTDVNGSQAVTLSGTGLAQPTDNLSPPSLTFLSTVVGQLSAAQPVTLTNNGGVALTGIAVSVTGPFQETDACVTSLAPQSSCAISVVYAPTQAGNQTGALTIYDALQTQTVQLGGTGVAAAAISVSPTNLSFAGQQVGVASAPQTLTVSNTGGSLMANVGFQITGLSAASFAWGANTCPATLSDVAGQNSCTVQVTYTPAAAGGAMASLAVSSSTAGVVPVNVPLIGAGQAAAGINVNPSQLGFGIVLPGLVGTQQMVTITNNGSSPASSLTLTATAPFSLAQNMCASTLAAGASCTTGVLFSPALAGTFTGMLTIASNSTTLATVPLSGMGGTPGAMATQPVQITLSQTSIGATSAAVTVTFTNPVGDVNVADLTVAATANFKVVNDTCPATLAAGASCTVGVEFKPAGAGEQNGSLTMGNNLLATAATVPLSGMGFDFTVASSGSSSASVASGQTADYALTITPLSGSQGAFTLQCGSLPSYSACTFSPAGESVAANSTGTEKVEIATGVSSSARLARPSGWPALPLACGLALMPLALRKRRWTLMLIVLAAIAMGGISSCTSSGVGISQPPPHSGLTPAGTYTIPVTVSSGGIQHQVELTLTVD